MTTPTALRFIETDIEQIKDAPGVVAIFVPEGGSLDVTGRRVNRLLRGAVARLCEDEAFEKLEVGQSVSLAWPVNMAAEKVVVVKLARRPTVEQARKAGATLAKTKGGKPMMVLCGNLRRASDVALGLALREYDFKDHKTGTNTDREEAVFMVNEPAAEEDAVDAVRAVTEGVFFTRDLTNEPANILTTTEFANRLKEMESLGLIVEVLEEKELEKLGMRTLLSVGQGSDSPTKVVVMRWEGGKKDAQPFALVGKGVVFDTGGISLKPAAGMEDMTMDMGGAGVVSGVMKTLAMRKSKANVVGLVGLVENMPSGNATRPGDVVTSMKGDTVEIINTDAEGRLVLADVLWYTQERFDPIGCINLATLTGAIIIGLGHENAGVFSNNDALANSFLKAADAEEEGAWRMPMGKAYDDQLKSRIADMKNVGGRPAGSITAAQFLQRFIKPETPWCHLDIAGVASVKSETAFAPKGATGWGVRALNRLIADNFETDE
ncbi:leucyl aminopeptidase [Litoreibacter roseus]|uniref:Probable cytosol aminopeptidase n=1 Tax=Litoreibacter roseus TaxID=2601869 RepID=A0A6N6JD09_9RHOB|nr:leucyl aminopeptidase [Litoreibacter roseus]GFE64056.1 putative cytosol aminopeptidase [Litoreibacter roseus]